MARTFGGASTDAVVTGLTTHATQRTYSIWARRTGAGGGNLGSMFRKRTAGAADILQLINVEGSNWYQFDNIWSGGGGQWSVSPAARPTVNEWAHIVVTYDSSLTTNVPQIYYNLVAQPMGTVAAPVSGSPSTNTDPFVIGNRTNDSLRNWAGDLAEFAVWDTLLSVADIDRLYRGNVRAPLSVQSASLVAYYPLNQGQSPDPDMAGLQTAATVTGTVFIKGPHEDEYQPPQNTPFVFGPRGKGPPVLVPQLWPSDPQVDLPPSAIDPRYQSWSPQGLLRALLRSVVGGPPILVQQQLPTTGQVQSIVPATVNGVATVSGTVVEDAVLSGSVSAVATVSATLVETGVVTGTVNGVATVSATLVETAVLTGTVNGVATVSSTVIETAVLAGTANGVATVSGTVVETAVLFPASMACSSSVGVSLVESGVVAGSVSCGAIVTSTLVETAVLVGTANGSSTVTGAVSEDSTASGGNENTYFHFFTTR